MIEIIVGAAIMLLGVFLGSLITTVAGSNGKDDGSSK